MGGKPRFEGVPIESIRWSRNRPKSAQESPSESPSDLKAVDVPNSPIAVERSPWPAIVPAPGERSDRRPADADVPVDQRGPYRMTLVPDPAGLPPVGEEAPVPRTSAPVLVIVVDARIFPWRRFSGDPAPRPGHSARAAVGREWLLRPVLTLLSHRSNLQLVLESFS